MKFANRTDWDLRPNPFTVALQEHRASSRELFDMTASNPPETGLKYEVESLLRAFNDPRSLQYHPEAKGLLSARKSVADYYAEVAKRAGRDRCGYSVDLERIVLTTSTSEAYTFAFRLLCNPSDEVLIPTPSYPLFEYLAGLQDVRLKPYQLFYDHGWHIDFHGLRQAIGNRSRAIMVVNPNNPTGSYVRQGEVEELNAICVEHDLALIVDEVFLDYTLGEPRTSFAFNREALTFTLSGISKISGLPQMKVAWLVVSGPGSVADEAMSRLEVIADTYLSMSAPIQLATPSLLAQRHSIQEQISKRVSLNLCELDRQLGRGVVSRLEVEGGWYAVLRVPRLRSDEAFVTSLLRDKNVLVQPGYFYDFPGEGYVVVSLITPEEVFRTGVARLLEHVAAAES